jgi:hypothetical protein
MIRDPSAMNAYARYIHIVIDPPGRSQSSLYTKLESVTDINAVPFHTGDSWNSHMFSSAGSLLVKFRFTANWLRNSTPLAVKKTGSLVCAFEIDIVWLNHGPSPADQFVAVYTATDGLLKWTFGSTQ